MSARSAQQNDQVPTGTELTIPVGGVFPIQLREEPNTKETLDYWSMMDQILDGHEYFGHMERGENPPSFHRLELEPEASVSRL